jgi:hypothetical protein
MKSLRIIVFAACAAYGAIIGANLAQATPMNGLLPAAPAGLPVEHVQLLPCVFPFNCGYAYGPGYYGGGYYGGGYYRRGYYGRGYYGRRYYGGRHYGHYYGRRYR